VVNGAKPAGGVVYLVGAGPGDPGLLTVRGRSLLERCDAIVYDALANPEIVASARRANPTVELHDAGKRGGSAESARQDDINALLVRLAGEGKSVVRLKGGDPLVFGRGSEEAQALAAAGARFEIVPGVTAGIAAPAYAGIPVTHRAVSTAVTFVTGHEDPNVSASERTDWAALARGGGTIVLYMGVGRLPAISKSLIAGGRAADTPAAAVQWGTYARQRTVVATLGTLADRIAAEKLQAPVITVIGDTVSLRNEIAWFEHRPLFGKRILVTRARANAAALSDRLRELGADVIEMPAIAIEPLPTDGLRRAIEQLDRYAWIILTSQNAVDLFWAALRDAGVDARALANARVAAVGPATGAALLARGIAVDLTPDRFVAEGLLDGMRARDDVKGTRVLYLAAEGARDVLPRGLESFGAKVNVVPIYRAVPDGAGSAELRARLEEGSVDLITFTSASSVNALVDAVGTAAAQRAAVASIGPVTTAAARAVGLRVTIEARDSTIDGLVAAIVNELPQASNG
jgi:uroporphyrinogen III methyltransferase/synthase